MSTQIPYKKKYSQEVRLAESKKILEKYPDRIPVIVTPSASAAKTNPITKEKFLVPTDLTLGQFQYVIRKRVKLAPAEAIFVFIHTSDKEESLATTSETMSAIYKKNVTDRSTDEDYDGFLYLVYSGENAFG